MAAVGTLPNAEAEQDTDEVRKAEAGTMSADLDMPAAGSSCLPAGSKTGSLAAAVDQTEEGRSRADAEAGNAVVVEAVVPAGQASQSAGLVGVAVASSPEAVAEVALARMTALPLSSASGDLGLSTRGEAHKEIGESSVAMGCTRSLQRAACAEASAPPPIRGCWVECQSEAIAAPFPRGEATSWSRRATGEVQQEQQQHWAGNPDRG